MKKSFIVILFIILAILLGCGFKTESNLESQPSLIDSLTAGNDVKNNLSELEETFSNFDYNKVIKEQSKLLPDGMSITKFRYFVVFSDMDDELTYKLIDTDIRNTIDAMTNNYVNKLPDKITPIFLFKDYDDYRQFVLKNYDIAENDISPYGFFKISKNVIVIRYVSWKGSIFHEVTHRFIKADFPNAPSWFDEGFASLNEKANFKNGNLIADFSFRIIPLRRALEDKTYTGIQYLMETNDDELYGKRTSFYYGQSRYLLMYLQEDGLLVKYYREFRDTYETDETGITQLTSITGKTINDLEEEYLQYIKSFKQ